MGWYKIGNRILSDQEMYAKSGGFLDLAVPSIVTGITIWILTSWFAAMQFFAVHTTTTKLICATTKLICVIFGFVVFMLSYAYRKLIVALVVIAFVRMIILLSGFAFFEWVLK